MRRRGEGTEGCPRQSRIADGTVGVADQIGTGEATHTPGKGTILYFRVSDIEGVCAAIREKGIIFTEEPHLVARMKSHDLWIAFFNDPSGNPLGLMAELPRTGESL